MKILLLGGTSDARQFAQQADERGLFKASGCCLIYSVAGLVRQPDVTCEVIFGGFSQFGGLASYIQQTGVQAILDMTHPYAVNMSGTALDVCKKMNIPYWRFLREPWVPGPGDNWLFVSTWSEAVAQCASYHRILLTVGQLTQEAWDQLNNGLPRDNHQLFVRTAAQPRVTLPRGVEWMKAIGPFDLAAEKRLLASHNIDVLVSKNSGGESTQAKLHAARELGVDVVMLNRPTAAEPHEHFTSIKDCVDHVERCLMQASTLQTSSLEAPTLQTSNLRNDEK